MIECFLSPLLGDLAVFLNSCLWPTKNNLTYSHMGHNAVATFKLTMVHTQIKS